MDANPSLPCPAALLDPSPVMGLLHDRLPLTLLLDLALGVSSAEVYASEPADMSWVPSRAA